MIKYKPGKQPLGELILACGDDFASLIYKKGVWFAQAAAWKQLSTVSASTPEEAVAKLWLALNQKDE